MSGISEGKMMRSFSLEVEKNHLQTKIKSWLRQIKCFKVGRLRRSLGKHIAFILFSFEIDYFAQLPLKRY